MKLHATNLLSLPGSIIAGVIVYLVLSSLLVPVGLTIAISITMSVLIFGLSVYYTRLEVSEVPVNVEKEVHHFSSDIYFVLLYVILIAFAFFARENGEIFVSWGQITVDQLIRLAAAVIVSLFAPGYAIVMVLDRRHELNLLPKLLLSYLLSLLVTGFVGYIATYSGFSVAEHPTIIGVVHAAILSIFIFTKIRDNELRLDRRIFSGVFAAKRIRKAITSNSCGVIVFGSLFVLLVLSTYYLYEGTIIGDQQYHHGRSLLFLSGNFRDIALSEIESPKYPPFAHAFLATFMALSNVPSVNAYASISLTNIMPVLAFYYLFSVWAPDRYKRAALLASTLFMLGSGFGWLYAMNMNISEPPPTRISALELLDSAGAKTFDVWVPNTFIIAAHPDVTTPLIFIALPAGFVLLSFVKQTSVTSRTVYLLILAALFTLGLLSHDEFGLFLIICAIVPLIFVLNKKDEVFIAILIGLLLTIFLGFYFPGGYYISRGIFGIPFVLIYLLFVASCWFLYRSKFFSAAIHRSKDISNKVTKIAKGNTRFTLGVVMISITVYVVALSFVVWAFQLPDFDARVNTLNFSVIPWHLYPLRFGITGLLGVSFLLSYIFKKFEKEIFIFGVIAIVAFLTLPQYLEFRSNKYIMASMDALAAFMIFKILSIFVCHFRKAVIGSILLGLVVTVASLSTIMYIAYEDLRLKNDSEQGSFVDNLGRRHFPSSSELGFLTLMRDELDSRRDENVALQSKEIHIYNGLGPWIEGFVGIPFSKVAQSKFTLAESSVEGFYKLLDYTNAHYIVLKKADLDRKISGILSFALENFPRFYEDDNYLVLSVPDLKSPSSEGDAAIVSPQAPDGYNLYPKSSRLSYTDEILGLTRVGRADPGNNSTLLGPTEQIWFNVTKENLNYIESTSRTIDDFDTNDTNHGILWKDELKTYYAFFQGDLLVLMTLNDGKYETAQVHNQEGAWKTLKVVYLNGMINLFFNDVLKIQVPQASNEFHISRVGLNTWNNKAEFLPLKLNRISPADNDLFRFDAQHKYDYYYLLSALALSKSGYEIFGADDSSAFSKRNIVLTSIPQNVRPYLDYVRNGGTVVVINSNNNFDSREFLNNLLCIEPGNGVGFDSIEDPSGQSLGIAGVTRNINVYCPASIITSYYLNDGQRVAPFVIEREYGNGKFRFVQASGYFESISKNPEENFPTLGNLSLFRDLRGKDSIESIEWRNAPLPHFAGNLTMTGPVRINSSSLLLAKNSSITAEHISFLEKGDSSRYSQRFDQKIERIKALEISGPYYVTMDTINLRYIPSSSEYSYIPLRLPVGSNMTLYLSQDSSAKMYVEDRPVAVYGRAEININKIEDPVSLSVKSPDLNVKGKTAFQNVRSHYPHLPATSWVDSWPLELYGETSIKLGHVNSNTEDGQYITYFDWNKVNTNTAKTTGTSFKGEVLEIPWREIMSSYFIGLITVPIVIIAGVTLYLGYTAPRVREVMS